MVELKITLRSPIRARLIRSLFLFGCLILSAAHQPSFPSSILVNGGKPALVPVSQAFVTSDVPSSLRVESPCSLCKVLLPLLLPFAPPLPLLLPGHDYGSFASFSCASPQRLLALTPRPTTREDFALACVNLFPFGVQSKACADVVRDQAPMLLQGFPLLIAAHKRIVWARVLSSPRSHSCDVCATKRVSFNSILRKYEFSSRSKRGRIDRLLD